MPEYIDPQCFIGYEYDFKSDIYSFGVILWEISSGKKPFESYRSKEAIAIHIYQGHREKRVEGTPPLYIELYERCWDNDPVNRPEMSVVLDKLAQLSSPINHRIKKGVPLNRLEDFITKQYISYHEFSEFSGLENIDLEDLGSTYEAAWRYRVIKVVLKCLKVNKNDSGKIMIQEFINKLNKLLQKIDFHQNIIELYGVTKDQDSVEEDAQREANRCHINWFQGVIKKYKLQEIPYASLNNKKRLGRGGFETVYRAKFSSLGYVAIKEVESDTDEKAQKLFINELKQHSRTNHERIIKFYGISLDMTEKTNYLVMEYANNGNLREYLRKNELEWPEKIRLTRQIAEGISYLHEIDITHRDLHTSNILIHNKNVKISDFGFSKKLNSIAIISSKFYGAIPFIDPCKLEDQNYPYDKKSDVYSFGMLMWEISSNGRVPFNQGYDPYLPLRIIQGLREKPITVTPRQYIDLYSKCWDHEPKKRPLMEQISPQLISLQLEPKYDATD
ncbi:kinase-like protein [Gigaspora margarita]|uniref:Kinase-like protein n=1 Tax=Gigaspora margarita TaxID=4874 RepID=A0A8H4AJ00_GIGMA|nr:kinase-like protein [Gigaspora margarita]